MKNTRKKTPYSRSPVLREFRKIYPDPSSELEFITPYQLIVSVILSAQCTDKKVNEITPTLFKKYGTFRELSRAKLSDIEKIIRPINYYRTKSKHLIKMAEMVVKQYGGEVPLSRETITTLPGVGRKTANVVLGELKVEPTLPVDTHVFRVAKRLGLSKGKTPEQVEADLMEAFPSSDWYNLHHWLIYHGRRVCKAQSPACASCTVEKYCPKRM